MKWALHFEKSDVRNVCLRFWLDSSLTQGGLGLKISRRTTYQKAC